MEKKKFRRYMKYTKDEKYMITSELFPWFPAREVEEMTGLKESAIYNTAHAYGIVGYRDNKRAIWDEFESERDAFWEERRKHQKEAIKEFLKNGNREKESSIY